MNGTWLSIVGIGEDGLDGLSPGAQSLVNNAELFIGGDRHLAMLPEDGRERLPWPSPLLDILPAIKKNRGRRVCVLATGDPMLFGIGVTLAKHFPISELAILPGLSAFSLACARLGWPLAEVTCLTLHGRPLDLLRAELRPGARILTLSDNGATPGAVADLMRESGFGGSRLTVFEHMDGAAERRVEHIAADWSANRVADFNTLAIQCIADDGAVWQPRVPGLPDDSFKHDGQLTKQEARAVTLAALAPAPGHLLWDVGAGCGSVAIEWLRCDRNCRAIAIEQNQDRIALIAENAAALGVPTLKIVTGSAPEALDGLQTPDAVFIGGGLSTDGLLNACWRAMKPGGRLVANAVTLESEQILAAWHTEHGGDLRRISIDRAVSLGAHVGWRPLRPVTQYAGVKT